MGRIIWLTVDGYERRQAPTPPPLELIERFCGGQSTAIAVWINDAWATLYCLSAARGYSLNNVATEVARRWPNDSARMVERKIYGPCVILQGFGNDGMQ